jgi:Cu+-exporting ATPase
MQKTFNVEGMTCAACSSAVERVVKKQAGVIDATVNLTTKKLTITIDESQFDAELIKEKIEKAGYEAKEVQKEKEVVMPIAGMT